MTMKSMIALVILASTLLWAADKLQPLNIKTGLWETTSTSAMSGAPPIPPEMLDKMTPEQKARFDQMIKARTGAPTTHTSKHCITKEKLEKDLAFGDERGKCTHDIVSSSSSGAEVKFHCADNDMTTDGTAKFQAAASDSVKGTVHAVTTGNGHTMTTDLTLTSRYLGPACGDIK